MTLTAGTQLGAYEIVAPLGAGGMGEVYRARDTRLDREVAVKVLPARFSDDPDRKQRFEREARTISGLSHPNICTLYDIGEQEGIDYLVMELLEGQTLAERVRKGPLPVDLVLRHGAEIAAALEAAHGKGIVHRDLKPGNIMLTRAGAKVLDFGLAKSMGRTSAAGSFSAAPTMTSPLTTEGALVGTFQYMAPEQLEGQEADARTDIFALGAVLYEMATGRRAFSGKTQASLIASILKEEPPTLAELQPLTPPVLDQVIRACLSKEPDERIQSAHDVRLQLDWISGAGSGVGGPIITGKKRKSTARVAWVVAVLASLIALASLVSPFNFRVWSGRKHDRMVHAQLLPPDGYFFDYQAGPPAISPDGTRLVFAAQTKDERSELFLRELADSTSRAIEGTAGGSYPFWSPDGRSIGFFADGKLKRVETDGGLPDTLCDAPRAYGGTWNKAGVVVFAGGGTGELLSIPASGGSPTPVTELDEAASEFRHVSPWFLPDGRHFFYTSIRGTAGASGVSIGSLDGEPPKRLLEVDSNAVYVEPGYVLFWRDEALRAQAFDPKSLELSGTPFVVAPRTMFQPNQAAALFCASQNGVLAYHPGIGATEKSRLVLRNRTGEEIGIAGPPGNFYSPRLSHDGSRVAVDNSGVQNNGDIWIYGVNSPVAVRVSMDPVDESRPLWSPDDSRIVYCWFGGASEGAMFVRDRGHPEQVETLLTGKINLDPSDWSPDGEHIAFIRENVGAGAHDDIWIYSFKDKQAEPFMETPFTEDNAQFSPDGAWIAYTSDESGRREVYLRSFPEPSQRRQISFGGGYGPRWRGDGKELFYMTPDGTIMAVEFGDEPGEVAGAPVPLFKAMPRFIEYGRDYDVTADGQTFLINTPIISETVTPMSLVINWSAGIKER